MVLQPQNFNRCLLLGIKAMRNLDSVLKSRDITLLTKVPITKAMVFPLWYFVPTAPNPESKEIKPFNPKENQSWIFIWRTDAETEAPVVWPPYAESWLIGKDLMLGNIEGRKRRVTEDEMVGWHHRLNRCEFEQTQKVNGQGSLAWYSLWGCKESDITEWLNNTLFQQLLLSNFIPLQVTSVQVNFSLSQFPFYYMSTVPKFDSLCLANTQGALPGQSVIPVDLQNSGEWEAWRILFVCLFDSMCVWAILFISKVYLNWLQLVCLFAL